MGPRDFPKNHESHGKTVRLERYEIKNIKYHTYYSAYSVNKSSLPGTECHNNYHYSIRGGEWSLKK